MVPHDDTIREHAWLIARGVRTMALVGTVELDQKPMENAFIKLGQIAGGSAIPFVIPRRDLGHAEVGYAAAPWIIDLFEWLGTQPARIYSQVLGLLLGNSAAEIADHDAYIFAGNPTRSESRSRSRNAGSMCKA
jgi:hypothetical protein